MKPRERVVSRSSRSRSTWTLSVFLLLICTTVPASAQKPRARDLGIPFEGTPGALNAITDVAGVEVGHATIVRGRGPVVIGEGPVRTGVTAVWPRGREMPDPVYAAWFSLNGDGEMTGTTWVRDSGIMEGPVMITNTLSVGVVHHAVIRWGVARGVERGGGPWLAALPVVAETWDGTLNDIRGQHVTEADALVAMEAARGGPVTEGNVGGGTGMICHRFKGGIGTSSRVVEVAGETYTVGVLVQCNYGSREPFRVAGVPVGREIADLMPLRPGGGAQQGGAQLDPADGPDREGSIIVVVATDAPVLCRTSSNGWLAVSRWASHAMGASRRTAPGTSSWPSRPPTRRRLRSVPRPPTRVCSPTGGSVRSSQPPSRRPKRRSSTRWSRRRR